MATTKPRITVTMPENLHSTLKRFAKLQKRSMSAVIVEILDTIHPPLMRTVALLEAAADAPVQVREGLRQVVAEIEHELNSSVGAGLDQMDWILQEVGAGGKAGSKATGRPASPPRKRVNPRPSNHGGQVGKTPSRKRVKRVPKKGGKS